MGNQLDKLQFYAAVLDARNGHSKGRARLIEMLRANHPLSAQDKTALGDFIEAIHSKGKKGRPLARPFTPSWRLAKLVTEIRALHESLQYRKATIESAMEIALFGQSLQGYSYDDGQREQILRELRRTKKSMRKK
jgi:hypothetical protein